MKAKQLISFYRQSPLLRLLFEELNPNYNIHIRGLSGALDSVFIATTYSEKKNTQLIILNNEEEVAYMHTDLKGLLGNDALIFSFPSSYKMAYEPQIVENANVLARVAVLNRIKTEVKPLIILSCPEAVMEKVITKKVLSKYTYSINVGMVLDMETMVELLFSYNFEKTDMVYEPGQFALRGGIIDVFSYAKDEPYRMELVGDTIASIRTFDIDTQISTSILKSIHVLPNIQTQIKIEQKVSFFDYFKTNTQVWLKDIESAFLIIDTHLEKIKKIYQDKVGSANGSTIVNSPDELYESSTSFENYIHRFPSVEMGQKHFLKANRVIQYQSSGQPTFQKDFEKIADELREYQEKEYTNIIVAELAKQHDLLHEVFQEISSSLQFEELQIGLREGFVDHELNIVCYTDHQLFERYHRYKTANKKSFSKALTLKELRNLYVGDFVTHADYGIGRFIGLESIKINNKKQEAIRLVFKDNDLLYVSVHTLHKISKYSGKEGVIPEMNKLGTKEWQSKKQKVKNKLKGIADELIKLYAQRKNTKGYAFQRDSFLQAELESSFMYQDTPDQAYATLEVKKDMEKQFPMDRLVCGDVGFGKTEIAIRATCKAVCDSKQVAVLVPTTILALQHYQTFSTRFKNFPISIAYINRFKSSKEVKKIVQGVKDGTIDVLIGTHKIVNQSVNFKDLGLLVVDEEQKFGVKIKDKLKEFKLNVDVLTLTATPIPRTLHFSLMGARDFSIISTPPPNRHPIATKMHTFTPEVIRDAIIYELERGGQVFFVHSRVKDLAGLSGLISKLVPKARVAIAHGQLDGIKLEKTTLAFINHQYDVLVSTNIIESGLDIPNANTIIIDSAHMFGLSDLHQMRGRVGRSNKKAFCYLLAPPLVSLTNEARKRLSALEDFSELGDGFKVAMRDLDIRGAGNLLGAEQSGFINDLGFETYHKILDDVVVELKSQKFPEIFKEELEKNQNIYSKDCNIETDLEILIPETYVSNASERLSLYRRLSVVKTINKLVSFEKELEDRFGTLPKEVKNLLKSTELKWEAQTLGVQRLVLKKGMMKMYLVSNENGAFYSSDVFQRHLIFVQKNSQIAKMSEIKNRILITLPNVTDVHMALCHLLEM